MQLNSEIPSGAEPITLEQINVRNQQFWLEESKCREKRITEATLFSIAKNDMRSENIRGIPLKRRKSLEQALADAEIVRNEVQCGFSQKGGRAPKRDVLQDVIAGIVREEPNITQRKLLLKLKKEEGQGTVVSIDRESDVLAGDVRKIHFVDAHGRTKRASVNGLKDRLSRAKKINSR
jgi:hypothetical protein